MSIQRNVEAKASVDAMYADEQKVTTGDTTMKTLLAATADQNRVLVNGQLVDCLDEDTACGLREFIEELNKVALLACTAAAGGERSRAVLHDNYDYASCHGCRINTFRYDRLVSELADEV